MAKDKKKNDKGSEYSEEVKTLSIKGPDRLYLIYGPEDYLSQCFIDELKKKCITIGTEDFNFKIISDSVMDSSWLQNAVDSFPFMSDRTLVIARDIDMPKQSLADALIELLKDIPEYCTVVIYFTSEYDPDTGLSFIQKLMEISHVVYFSAQNQSNLIKWIQRHYEARGKSADLEAINHLIFISGNLMNRLLPEIEKTASYAKGTKVTVDDVEAIAHHIPEADVFKIIDYLANKQNNNAISRVSEMLDSKETNAPQVVALLASQFRRLYIARYCVDYGLGTDEFRKLAKVNSDYAARQNFTQCRGFSAATIKRAVITLAETEYRIKSTSTRDTELLAEALIRIASGET